MTLNSARFANDECVRTLDSVHLHVSIGGLVGLALKVHLTQARGTLSMGPHVYARHA